MKINQLRDDPIQNRVLSDQCWDGKHFRMDSFGQKHGCEGWHGQCQICGKNKCHGPNSCVCACHTPCECMCHEAAAQKRAPRKKFDKHSTMDILETGCGEIEIK